MRHCAATLNYEDERAEPITAVNHLGTRNVIGLARQLHAELNHVSTAYIAPRWNRAMREVPPSESQPAATATPYQPAKLHAEYDVTDSGLAWRILRPSFIVSHSVTHRAAMGRRLRISRHAAADRRTVLAVAEDTECNLIPVDVVARAAAAIAAGPTGTIYRLTNASPPPSRKVLDVLFEWSQLPAPQFSHTDENLPAPVVTALGPYLEFFERSIRSVQFQRCCGIRRPVDSLEHLDLRDLLDNYLAELLAV